MSANNTILSRSVVVGDLAEILGIPADSIEDDDNIADLGLDSVRLMVLVEKWRALGAEQADLISLSSDPRVGVWIDLLTEGAGSRAGAE